MSKFQNPVLHFGLSLIFVIHRSFGSLNSVNVHRNLIRVFPRIYCANSAIPLQFDLAVSRHCLFDSSFLAFHSTNCCLRTSSFSMLVFAVVWQQVTFFPVDFLGRTTTTALSVHSTLLQCTSALHVCSIFGAFCSLSASLLSYRYFVDIVFGINGPQC